MRNIGDVVHIKRDLIDGESYGSDIVVSEMLGFLGAQAVIVELDEGEYILDVDEGHWDWTDEMLED